MVEVVVPWRGGCPHRERAWSWVREHLGPRGWSVTLAEAPAGPWCKAAAIMPAIAASTADLIVVADADIWTPNLERAATMVEAGRAPWAIPHGYVVRMTEEATAAILDGTQTIAPGVDTEERLYRGVEGGGAVVLPRELALDIPMDPRFQGWGQEDHSWGYALEVLAGRPWRGSDPLFHFWHPPQERMSRRIGSVAGHELFTRYHLAVDSPEAMRAIIEEAKCSPIS